MSKKILGFLCAAAFVTTIVAAQAQQTAASPAPSWLIPDLLPAARAEGGVTVYSSVNEEEGLPLWKNFEQATGIPVSYVRGSDSELAARIAIEGRARKKSWDLFVATSVSKLPPALLQAYDLPEAAHLIPEARDPNHLWYGSSANYNMPAYNTKLIKASDLPTSYEGFLDHPEWKGRIAVEGTDSQWLSAIFSYYGEDRARKLITDFVKILDPVVVDGHLALARSVGAGEYAFALNNYENLPLNVRMSGAPTDVFALDPVALFMIQIGMSANAPHPKAALLAANFLASREAQQFATSSGRIPVRSDVTPNPPDAISKIGQHKIVATLFTPADDKKWAQTFKELFRPQ
ncbi:MAG TPA: extracellular solute-binding protein [Beijerinckiaceae bacterium]|nr:extracellular solute-binding protein [Beijerinckiaceae bacterium]